MKKLIGKDFRSYQGLGIPKNKRYRKIERKENGQRLGVINDRFPSTYFELLTFTGIHWSNSLAFKILFVFRFEEKV